MSIDCFLKLKEIDSLTKMRFGHLKTIEEQEARLGKLNNQLEEAHSKTEKLKHEQLTLQHELYEIEKKLALFHRQRQNLMDIGESGEKFIAPIDEAESHGLLLIDRLEAIGTELTELKQFEIGLSKTIEEIGQEVRESISIERKEIAGLDLRLEALEEELPPNFRDLLKRVQAKNLAHGSFTRNEAGSCYFCRYKISRMDESEIDLQKQLKQCPQCSRIFLPYGS